ncbi:hypothetical protein HHSLTHF2_11010 [Vreelandella venusta]|uniref:Uncharacterized protein n=1 Tax=Halomonas hydrothermalis TaxID=115561 RepID=A0A6F8U219_9GAMM|nr:hypothetical protein [Halomonas hydrothermalis]BCB07211.1 hypothetical protein HHSLTHF2_11010 [Halomonas hydrothermalis]
MNRHTSKLAERREHEGIGRLWAAGIDPETKFLASMIPPRCDGWAWERHPCELYCGEAMPASVIANALGIRLKTFYEWTNENGFPEPYPAEVLLPERLFILAENGGDIHPKTWEKYAGAHVFGRKLRRGEKLWCGEAIGLWIFATRGHRIGYAYAWWMLEAELGTWTPETGYIKALPMTKQQWINDWHNV